MKVTVKSEHRPEIRRGQIWRKGKNYYFVVELGHTSSLVNLDTGLLTAYSTDDLEFVGCGLKFEPEED